MCVCIYIYTKTYTYIWYMVQGPKYLIIRYVGVATVIQIPGKCTTTHKDIKGIVFQSFGLKFSLASMASAAARTSFAYHSICQAAALRFCRTRKHSCCQSPRPLNPKILDL